MIITCKFSEGEDEMSFHPFPGGQKARHMGCTCPYQPFIDGHITFDSDCPVHELEKLNIQ